MRKLPNGVGEFSHKFRNLINEKEKTKHETRTENKGGPYGSGRRTDDVRGIALRSAGAQDRDHFRHARRLELRGQGNGDDVIGRQRKERYE